MCILVLTCVDEQKQKRNPLHPTYILVTADQEQEQHCLKTQ